MYGSLSSRVDPRGFGDSPLPRGSDTVTPLELALMAQLSYSVVNDRAGINKLGQFETDRESFLSFRACKTPIIQGDYPGRLLSLDIRLGRMKPSEKPFAGFEPSI